MTEVWVEPEFPIDYSLLSGKKYLCPVLCTRDLGSLKYLQTGFSEFETCLEHGARNGGKCVYADGDQEYFWPSVSFRWSLVTRKALQFPPKEFMKLFNINEMMFRLLLFQPSLSVIKGMRIKEMTSAPSESFRRRLVLNRLLFANAEQYCYSRLCPIFLRQ